MDTIETQTDEHAATELKGLIERTLAGARVPRDTRDRLSSILETAMRDNLSLVRRYVRALAYNGRAAEMMEMYAEGQTLDEIGTRYEITRERVRQILTSTFGDYRTAVPEEIRHERALRRMAERVGKWDDEHGPDIVARFNEGQSDVQIAETLGLPRTKVADFRSRKGLRHTRGVDWTDDDILDALKRCYQEVGQGLTIACYSEWREADPKKAPSYLTVLIRYESFEAACSDAEVPYVGRSIYGRRSDYITSEVARDHLAGFLEWTISNNKKATSGTFAEYRKAVPGVPSMAVMSRRLGGFRLALDGLLAQRASE
jgi:DNA-binding CsgD family transcriptional regulator